MFEYHEDPREAFAAKLIKARPVYKKKYAEQIRLTTNLLANYEIIAVHISGFKTSKPRPGVLSNAEDAFLGVYDHPLQQTIFIHDVGDVSDSDEILQDLRSDIIADFDLDILTAKTAREKRETASLLLHLFA